MPKKLPAKEKLERFLETLKHNFFANFVEYEKIVEELLLENGVETRRVAKRSSGD